ncbi:MAG: hypothetical protein NTY77_09220 [Elusimicrobia bacterium]|nr:hypothetical protein [Elusimicrobiota bacterium]
MKDLPAKFSSFLIILGLTASAAAAPIAREDVPGPLQGWISWVLKGQEGALCSFFHGQDRKECLWPGALKLALDEKGGRFEQGWRVEAPGWAVLPGGSEHWPQDVRLDGGPGLVLRRGDSPALFLKKAGAHVITGSFRWERLPEQLVVPPETGLLALAVRGEAVEFPQRDELNHLWLQAKARPVTSREEARIVVTVHRRLVDEVPLQLLTRVQLKVSGPDREAVLGRALPEGFTPMALVSPIPARLDPDGHLRVQVRAGLWDVALSARRASQEEELRAPVPGGTWDNDEVWVFDAKPDLRQADLEGAPALDPQQTQLPEDWKSLPAFLVKPGTVLRLVQRRRGDDPPPADRLSLSRELWLDFDGRGFSARDRIKGTLNRSWRLDAAPGTDLGRVSVDDEDQFLTSLTSGAAAGLEMRRQEVNVTADSRFEGRRPPAAGWRHDFESVSALLHLPPGWRLFAAGGVDQASSTWTGAWTLLDFFLLLIAVAAFQKLFGRPWGLTALVGLGLAWHEPGAPRWLWLLVILCAALHRALAEHPSAGKTVLWARRGAWAVLAMVCLPFFLTQARTGLFPILEHPLSVQPRGGDMVEPASPAETVSDEAQMETEVDAGRNMPAAPAMQIAASLGSVEKALKRSSARQMQMNYVRAYPGRNLLQNQLARDPNARVTTGPGIPYWQWSTASLTWSGPVPQGHRMRLWLLCPAANLVLAFARIFFIAALALLLGGFPVEDWLRRLRALGPRPKMRAAALLLIAVLPMSAGAQSFPPRELLDELRGRLLEKPECAPLCAESPRLQVTAAGRWLSLKLEIQAAAATAVPIPTGGRDWTPTRASLDGTGASVRRAEDGQLWAVIPAGSHQLNLEGPLPDSDAVQVSLPLRPRRVDASVSGWTLHGVREDGRPEANLQLSRSRSAAAVPTASARAQGTFPPFLMVQRTLRFGLSWTVDTFVTRLTPTGTPVVAEIPLLPGESVTSSDLRVVKGNAQVNIPAQAMTVVWSSVLKETPSLALSAPRNTLWAESWRVEPGPLWHVTAEGVPAMHQEPGAAPRSYAFRPWPGESVAVTISRPAAAMGQTLTMDQSVLELKPGLRATEAALTVALRSSRGGQHVLALPAGADLLSVRIDGAARPIRLEGDKLSVPVAPGAHTVEVSWRQDGGARLFYRAPAVDLGAPSVNSHVSITMPARRWALLLGGRGMGPVVLFWSFLVVSALVCFGLSRTGLTPLTWGAWFLLSVGMIQASLMGSALVAGWFLLVGLRGALVPKRWRDHQLAQMALAVLTLAAAVALFMAIKQGLLGQPDMQIAGNGSHASLLRWYNDRAGPVLPRPWALTFPLWFYRLGMLAWSLWLAQALISWARWAWGCYSAGGLWRRKEDAPKPPDLSQPKAA